MPIRASTSTLVSLAMLTERINNNEHYLDNFTPFILHIIRGTSIGNAVDEGTIQQDIKDKFGLFIPKHSITLLFGRLAKSKILRRDHGEFLIQKDIGDDLKFEPTRANLERSMTEVVTEFKRFSKNEHEYEMNTEKAYEIIFGFLSEFSIECLAAYERNTPFPSKISRLPRKEQVLIASFFRHLQANHAGRFERFSDVVKGYMFMNSILCPDLTEEKFSKTTFYLDTPILINALGLNGDRGKGIANEMIKILMDKEGTLRIFDHTGDELSNFIMWLADHGTDTSVLNPAAVEMRESGKDRAYMITLRGQYRQNLQSMGIRIEDAPSFDPKNFQYQIGEEELEGILREEVNYLRNPNAALYDVKSVRAIQVLRQGKNPERLERAKAVFVTSNSRFAKAVKHYESREARDRPKQDYRVPSVVTDLDVTTVAWLKSSVTSEIPEQRFMANIYAMLNPGENFGGKILKTAENLRKQGRVSEEALLFLKSDMSLIEMFNERNLGDPNKAESPEDIEDFLKQADLERKAEIKKLQNSHMKLQEMLNEKIRHEEANQKQQRDNIDSIAKWLTRGILIVFTGFAIVFWVISGENIVGAMSTIFGFFGITIPGIRDWISSKIANFIKENLLGAK